MDKNATKIESLDDLDTVRHWKVGDGMKVGNSLPGDYPEGFIIGNMAVIQRSPTDFEIAYFDEQGRFRGSQDMAMIKQNKK